MGKCLNWNKWSQDNQFKHLVYIILYAAGTNFKIINNLKAEYISVCPHRLSQQNKQERQAERLGSSGYWGIICSIEYRLPLSFPCLLLTNTSKWFSHSFSCPFQLSYDASNTRHLLCGPFFLICTANLLFCKNVGFVNALSHLSYCLREIHSHILRLEITSQDSKCAETTVSATLY